MCLGIPGKVLATYREDDVLMGKIEAARVFDFLERMNQLGDLEVRPP